MKYFIFLFINIFFLVLPSSAQVTPAQTDKATITEERERGQQEPNYVKRLKHYRAIRGLDDPDAPKNYAAHLFKEYRNEQNRRSSGNRANSGRWQSDGPALFEEYTSIGRVNRLAFHPTDSDRIYAATAGGGLWHTPNHGLIWYPLSDNIPVNNLSGVVVDQNDPDILYILTGDGAGNTGTSASSGYSFTKPSIGVLKSTDHGQTWNTTGLTFDILNNVTAWNLIADPNDPDIQYASTSNGVYRTDDGWETSSLKVIELIYEVRFNTAFPNIIYAIGQSNFYRSVDGGDTWSFLTSIPGYYGQFGRMTFSTCPGNSDRLFIYSGPQEDTLSTHRGVYRSDDGGSSFMKLDSVSNVSTSDQTSYDITCLCNPNNNNQLLIGTVRISKSTDTGNTFSESPGLHADQHELSINPLLPNRIYIANDGGIYYSDNFGEPNSWNYISEQMRISQYFKIAIGQENDQLVIGGSQDNGTHRNNNNNNTYKRIHHSDGMDCAIHPNNDDLLIASTQRGNFAFSTNQGESYSHYFGEDDLPESVQTAWVTPVSWSPTDSSIILLGYEPIYGSTDGGLNFFPIPDTIGGNIALHMGNTNRIYASDRYNSNQHQLHMSNDMGGTWTPLHVNMDTALFTRRKTGITTNPNNDMEVWVSVAGWVDTLKVFSSPDAGQTWENETGSLPNIPVNCIIYGDPDFTPAGSVYVGTDLGVYYRNDDLGDWIHFSNDLPAVEIADLELQYDSQTLYAGTYGRGIWHSEQYTDCPPNLSISQFSLLPKKDYFFQAQNSITLSDYIIESLGANMKLKAGNFILLESGVIAKTENGNLLKARLSPCGGGVEE